MIIPLALHKVTLVGITEESDPNATMVDLSQELIDRYWHFISEMSSLMMELEAAVSQETPA